MGLEFREVEAGMVMPVRGAERHRHHVGRGSRHTPLPQGGSIGQPPAYLLSSAASAPSSGSSAIGGEGRERTALALQAEAEDACTTRRPIGGRAAVLTTT